MVKSEKYLKKFELSRYIYLVKILFSRFNILLVCIYTQYKHVCMKKNYQSTFFPTFPISMNSSFLNMMEYFYVFLSSRKKLRRHFVTKTYSKLRFYPPKKWVLIFEGIAEDIIVYNRTNTTKVREGLTLLTKHCTH